tara:strand:+ start:7613 stop:7756 length:144 start_codon:yes stop_codon:yes gene_type:complete
MKEYEVRVKVPGTYYSVKVKAASESEAISEAKKKTPKWISIESVKEI